jgi:anti-anti-sigma factor
MPFHVRISRFTYADATVIAIDGDLDLASVNALATPAEESILTRRPIVFDLSGCTYIDTSALRFLLEVSRWPDVRWRS